MHAISLTSNNTAFEWTTPQYLHQQSLSHACHHDHSLAANSLSRPDRQRQIVNMSSKLICVDEVHCFNNLLGHHEASLKAHLFREEIMKSPAIKIDCCKQLYIKKEEHKKNACHLTHIGQHSIWMNSVAVSSPAKLEPRMSSWSLFGCKFSVQAW